MMKVAMKVKSNPSKLQRVGFILRITSILALAAGVPLSAQVVIEGGPGTVQISDKDGQPENTNSVPSISRPITSAVPAVAGGTLGDGEKVLSVEANALEGTSVNLPAMKENVKVAPSGPVAAVSVVPVKVTQRNPTTVKRLAELKRELEIQDAGNRAAVAVTTEGLFKEDTEVIDDLSISRLQTIAEYLRLSEEDQVDVTYHFDASEESKESAWGRSLSIVNWMETKGQVTRNIFRLNDPVQAARTPVRTNPQNPGDTEVVAWIEFSMK